VGTSRENTLDASRSGLLPRGAGYWNTKLTPAQVNQIRELTDAGLPTVEIAQRFGISHDAVRNIRIGRSWSWLKRAA
jgi:DNA invertase Pin-like site-specific DNA recombinase